MQKVCGEIRTFPKIKYVVKLMCHKIVEEMFVIPFGEGWCFGESRADYFQQFYGFFFC